MRVLLIQAPLGRVEPLVYPLGLSILATAIRPEIEVKIADPNLQGENEVESIIQNFSPDVIGLSLRNIDSQMKRDLFYYYQYFKKYLRRIRKMVPHCCIILGGSGFSLFPEKIMVDNPDVDLGVYLEGEETFPELLAHLENPEQVAGVYYRCDDLVCFTGMRSYPDLVHAPFPSYDLLSPKLYEADGGVGVQTKRGCPLTCAYCTYPHLNGSCYRMRPQDQIFRELEMLIEEGVQELTFVDGVFNLPKERTIKILEEMQKRRFNVKWRGWFIEKTFDKDFALLCRVTGCSEFSFSPDGFSPGTLSALGKSITREDIIKVCSLAEEMEGIRIALNFFWNPPGQTFTDFLRMLGFTFKFKMNLRSKAGGVIFGNPRIEPNTPLWQRAVAEGIIGKDMNLLPDSTEDLKKTFYSNPSTRYLDAVYYAYAWLWKIKTRGRRRKGMKVVDDPLQ